MTIALVSIFVFLINIPFGYWRANVQKFSVQWVLAIHVPIPFILLVRIYSDIGFALYSYPILVLAFFLGQLLGRKISDRFRNTTSIEVSSFLFKDIYKLIIQ